MRQAPALARNTRRLLGPALFNLPGPSPRQRKRRVGKLPRQHPFLPPGRTLNRQPPPHPKLGLRACRSQPFRSRGSPSQPSRSRGSPSRGSRKAMGQPVVCRSPQFPKECLRRKPLLAIRFPPHTRRNLGIQRRQLTAPGRLLNSLVAEGRLGERWLMPRLPGPNPLQGRRHQLLNSLIKRPPRRRPRRRRPQRRSRLRWLGSNRLRLPHRRLDPNRMLKFPRRSSNLCPDPAECCGRKPTWEPTAPQTSTRV